MGPALWAGLLAVAGVVGLLLTRTRRDVVTLLTIVVALTFALSARWIVGSLGAIGQPALLIALVGAWWWAVARMSADRHLDRGPNPLRTTLLAFSWFLLLSFSLAFTRPLTSLETTSAIRAVVVFGALIGLALLIGDGVSDRDRLDVLLRRLLLGATFLAIIGVVQFVFGTDPWTTLRPPFLSLNHDVGLVNARALFNRPYATALHPIEFGVVTASLVPLALHYSLYPLQSTGWVWRLGPVLLLGAAVPMSISRSGVVSLVTGLLVISFRWSWARRLTIGAAALAFTILLWGLIPGLLGTLRSMFVNLGNDPSVQARTDRLPHVIELFSERPLMGLGFGTYNLEDYFLLDNQIYATLLSVGLIGTLVWVAVMVVLCVGTLRATRGADPATTHLGGAIVASIAALLVSTATFDAFAFRILTTVLFILLGAGIGLWRLRRDHPPQFEATRDQRGRPSARPSQPMARSTRDAARSHE